MAPRKTKKELDAKRKKTKAKKKLLGPVEADVTKDIVEDGKKREASTAKQEKDKARMNDLKKNLADRVSAGILYQNRKRTASAAASSSKTPAAKKGKKETSEEIDDEGTDSEDSDEEDTKPAAVENGDIDQERYNDPESGEESVEKRPPAELRTALIEAEERVARAERQVRAISKIRIADTFVEGQVRTWAKESLWKMCKFITNENTMNQIMAKASKHFQVPESERQQWMATFAHIVRDGLNQKRNACCQDLRKSLKSKLPEQHQ
jgi:hypothetical protein